MVRDRLESSLLALRSSNSQRRLQVFLAGGGADGEGDLASGGAVKEVARSRGEGDARLCRRGGMARLRFGAGRAGSWLATVTLTVFASDGDAGLDADVSQLTVLGSSRRGGSPRS